MAYLDDALSFLLAAALGVALLLLGSLAAVGGARTLRLARGFGFVGALLALFVGVVVESLAPSLVESPPYTLAFLPSSVLRVQALAEDPDLRTRYNVDPRLRYLGGEVPNLEAPYARNTGLRFVKILPVEHASPTPLPAGVVDQGEEAVDREVDGLYERAVATLADAGRPPVLRRLAFLGAASVGFLGLGVVGFLAGAVPLVGRRLALLGDVARLLGATRHRSYRGARGRAIRAGTAGLAAWHGERARPHLALATFGLLVLLGGVLLGLLREEERRRSAHDVFAQARRLRIEGAARR